MGSRVLLALTVLVFLIDGRAPGIRELRNPDAEAGFGRSTASFKRSWH